MRRNGHHSAILDFRDSGGHHRCIILLFDDIICNRIWGEIMQSSDRIGRRIKLQDLHILMTVVQAGSMGKAARLLNTSQPNVSKSISDLEHALGVTLLDRHRQGVEPTEYGRAVLDCGTTVFDELRQGEEDNEFLPIRREGWSELDVFRPSPRALCLPSSTGSPGAIPVSYFIS